jgi:parallel beta-helix repeat protein
MNKQQDFKPLRMKIFTDLKMMTICNFFLTLLVFGSCTKEATSTSSQLNGPTLGSSQLSTRYRDRATLRYTSSQVINLNGAHDTTISGQSIAGGDVPSITLTNCYNIHITKSKLYNSTAVGIYLYKCKNITIDYNYFTNVSSGVYAEQTTEGGIVVNYNQFLNMVGPFPRGQFVQFNNVSGPNSSISYNKGENIFGKSYPEDAISLYQSNGTPSSPTMVIGNWIRGGGPSSSGGGVMLGDNGGSYLVASNNILVNPGEYGMAIVGGDHNTITNNSIYGVSQYFTNVGLYTNSINGYTITNSTMGGNKVKYFNSTNYENNAWIAPGTMTPALWETNIFGANIDASILPDVIITYK